MSKRTGLALAILLGALSLSPGAGADAVMGPPSTCPPGAVGDTSHNGPWCRPTTCVTDDDCTKVRSSFDRDKAPPLVCREQPLCVETRTEPSRSGWSGGKPITRDFALAECNATLTCTAPATCETVKRCVQPPPLVSTGKCHCTAAGLPADTSPLWWTPLLLVASLLRRRRQT